MTSGIYEIVNAINDRRYVGQSVDIEKRLRGHWRALNLGEHRNRILQRAVQKYSILAFYWRVLEEVPRGDLNTHQFIAALTAREQFHMDQTPAGAGYQLAPAAGTNLGIVPSKETREKLAARSRGRRHSPETKARISATKKERMTPEFLRRLAELRKPVSQEAKDKMRAAARKRTPDYYQRIGAKLRGRKASIETREKLSAAHKGRRHSEESRRKMVIASTGKKHSAETKAKISAILRVRLNDPDVVAKMLPHRLRRRQTEETKAKLSRLFKGRFVSQETRDKISAAKKLYYAQRRART